MPISFAVNLGLAAGEAYESDRLGKFVCYKLQINRGGVGGLKTVARLRERV